MPSKHRLRSPRPQSLLLTLRTLVLVLVAFALVAAPSVDAVRINVSSCPTDSRASSSSSRTPQLQWHPVRAEANFEPLSDSYNLQLVVWGNVSGAMNPGALPPADDPYWSDPRRTNGKIVELPDPDNKKATTLIRKVNVLTVERWNERVNFCKDGLVNGTCPLSPVFDVENADLPSVNLSHEFPSSYAFSSFVATMLIIYGDNAKTTIGCMSSTITPDLGSIASVLRFLPFSILVVSALAVILAGLFSPWGSTNIFHWSSNYGRDTDLLRLITPGFGDCLQYIQFVVLTGGLSLAYPGYYQPIVSQAAWSSLMFNQTIITHAYPWQSIVDGIYVTNSTQGYGLHQLGQLVGMALATDIWSGTMVWLCVIIAGVFLLTQACFFLQWLWRKINNISEEDLRAKNIPFSTGNLVRIVLNYMLVPVVALSTFHLVVASSASPYTIALAVVTLALVMLSSTWILAVVIRTRPKSVLFDDLPTVLRFGPLYNTYSDEVAAFALIPVLLNSIRGVAIGAVQSSGVAQIVLLAICEVIQVFTIHAFRPFHSATSMNAHHTLFSCLRAITILLMVAFVPSLGVNEGSKAWIGYAILLVHGLVLILGFFLSAFQTIVEVAVRMLGAGGDNATGLRRGGLSKIFGMRQLSRRETHRPAPSRASQLSTTGILDMEDGGRADYAMPSGRVRSGSAASLAGIALHHRHRSSSALDSIDMYSAGHRHMNPSVSSCAPGTPGETTTFSFLGPATHARHHAPMAAPELSDPYYRPPRRRRETTNDLAYSDVPPDAGGGIGGDDSKRPAPVSGEAAEAGEEAMLRGMTLAPPNPSAMNLPTNRPDYSTREVDFYYGVRGPALNSEGPGRKLGTGPADPTGPVATATGWFRNMFRGKTKETGKGFKVVRSARMPPGMMSNGGFGDETPPEGIPVAMGVLRNGPIDSDDEDDVKAPRVKYSSQATPSKRRPTDLLTDSGDAQTSDADDETVSPADEEQGARLPVRASSDPLDDQDVGLPVIPRKSSKRNSDSMDRGRLSTTSPVESGTSSPLIAGAAGDERQPEPSLLPSDLPFARTASRRRASSKSSLELATGISQGQCERPASYGTVRQHGISRVDPDPSPTNLLSASSAEVVDGGGGSTASATKPC